jgi:predicted dehydrogenase
MPDLGVYDLTFLTGLLGPVRSVMAMANVVTPKRIIQGKGEIAVSAEDNAMVLMDHGEGCLSHVQCGFNYFVPNDDGSPPKDGHTLTVTGTDGQMGLVGHGWGPRGVDLGTLKQPSWQRHATDADGYSWQMGASALARALVDGEKPLFTAEHAVHVVELIAAARESQKTGQRIELESSFPWPIVS